MKVVLRAVGKLKDRRMEELCREYLDRVRRHLPVEVVEVEQDGELVRQLPPGAEVVALEPGGEAWTTAEMVRFLSERMVRGTRAVVFLIGGADGLSAATVARAGRRLSLSPLTLPHRLARVILCEQIYRCVSAIRGEPYNR
jgi:23S rRNA (pseudouridine1915-N3)-methyltransferase